VRVTRARAGDCLAVTLDAAGSANFQGASKMMRSRRFLSTVALALALGATVPACVVRAQGSARFRSGAVVVYDQPPEPRYEQVTVRPGYLWIRGHWEWRGGRWDWTPGHWERERGGYVWVDGYWERRGNSWHWVSGRWSAGGSGRVVVQPEPAPERERHRVVDHRRPEAPPVHQVDPGYPTQPPPPVRSEAPGPRSGYVWITGRWDWRNGNWEWIPGHWERARARMVWVAGRWELRGNHYIWVEGSWQRQ
jgi:hypothetical protein